MTRPHSKQKLYCYVDESGQYTEGRLFLVAVVVASDEREELIREAEKIEQASGKSLKKWHRAEFNRRVEYIKAILSSPLFTRSLFFAHYTESKAYLDLTVYAAAQAILQRAQGPYKATAVVDGLSRTDVPLFTRGLRALRIAVHKVCRTKEESDALICLADALAGFVRDYLAGEPYARELYRTLHTERVLKELP